MKKAFLLSIILIASCFTVKTYAQQAIDEEGKQKWMTEIRNYKHEFMIKELELDKSQQQVFFAAYDEMEDRINTLNADTRELEQRVISDPNASDVELEAASRALFELKSEESKIELEYFDKFKATLNPKQLIRLKNTERKFTQQLVQHHRRLRNADGQRRKQ